MAARVSAGSPRCVRRVFLFMAHLDRFHRVFQYQWNDVP
jgi:hypothetical protein